jgi:hypothetical protein
MRTMTAALAPLVIGVLSCGMARAEDPGLVGTWAMKTDQAQVESTYTADGAYVCKVVPTGGGETRTIRGTYRVAGGALDVQIEGRDSATSYKWRLVDAGTLELTDSGGNSTRMTRQKAPPSMDPIRPRMAKLPESASGHILYTRTEVIEMNIGGVTKIPVPKIFTMTGEGKGQAPFIYPQGPFNSTAARQACWAPGGKGVVFTSDFEMGRSALFTDVFLLDLAKGSVVRASGNEWSAGPVEGVGTVYGVVEADGTGTRPEQVNVCVQGMGGQIFRTTQGRVDKEGQVVPGQYVYVIEGVPAGKVWVKAWVSRHVGDLKMVDVSAGRQNLVDTMNLSQGNMLATNPSITPDGRYMVVLSQKAFYVADPRPAKPGGPMGVKEQGYDTMGILDLTKGGQCVFLWDPIKMQGMAAKDPMLSPDGKRVAFTMGQPLSESIAVCSLEALLAGRPDPKIVAQGQRLLNGGTNAMAHAQPAWSPDGKKLAFVRLVVDTSLNLTGNLCVASLEGAGGGQTTRLAANQVAANPSWSPDGKHVAFGVVTGKREALNVLDVAGLNITSDVYTVGADGSDMKQLTNDGRSSEPAWGP